MPVSIILLICARPNGRLWLFRVFWVILPELNEEDLEELGVKSKPVLLKKSIIDRNLSQHPEVSKDDYEMLTATALYNADAIIPGNAEKHEENEE